MSLPLGLGNVAEVRVAVPLNQGLHASQPGQRAGHDGEGVSSLFHLGVPAGLGLKLGSALGQGLDQTANGPKSILEDCHPVVRGAGDDGRLEGLGDL